MGSGGTIALLIEWTDGLTDPLKEVQEYFYYAKPSSCSSVLLFFFVFAIDIKWFVDDDLVVNFARKRKFVVDLRSCRTSSAQPVRAPITTSALKVVADQSNVQINRITQWLTVTAVITGSETAVVHIFWRHVGGLVFFSPTSRAYPYPSNSPLPQSFTKPTQPPKKLSVSFSLLVMRNILTWSKNEMLRTRM